LRLSKIKLACFKTFVDSTTIKFPSNLMGVVGPNGCGKSNIIDGIRWVLGEGSAKNLRGNSNEWRDKEIHELGFLTGQERQDLQAFLESLTGEIPENVGPPTD
jgi:predicted ATP-dependent endonuclease of OLD family